MMGYNSLASLMLESWTLAAEAGSVVALRTGALATMDSRAASEARLMVSEKLAEAAVLPWLAATGAFGMDPMSVTRGSMKHLRAKVRANRKRLSKPAARRP